MVVNAHIYIDSLCAQKTICLGVTKVLDHKSTTIYETVAEVLKSYGQQIENVGIINTDNASANKKAFR